MTRPSEQQIQKLRRIAKREAVERTCPKCKRKNAIRRAFVDGQFERQCSWPDCKHVVKEQ